MAPRPNAGHDLLILEVSISPQRRTTVGWTPLDGLSTRRKDLYLTTHNTPNRQLSMPPVGFEPTISAAQRPQTYVLDGAATETVYYYYYYYYYYYLQCISVVRVHVMLSRLSYMLLPTPRSVCTVPVKVKEFGEVSCSRRRMWLKWVK
jgi:hypothetical protein